MGDPIATADDLATFLGDEAINTDRATLMVQLAQSLCESIVSPITEAALPIVLAVASRCYANATSAHSVGVGTGQVSFGAQNSTAGIGGLYLSRADKAALRRLAGRTGAFTIDTTPDNAGANLPYWDRGGFFPYDGLNWSGGLPNP